MVLSATTTQVQSA